MKILILADIHSNWAALSAIRESFDICLFAGDLVDYATDPILCIDWVRKHAAAAVRGNHDHAVAQKVPALGGTGFRQLALATRPLHWRILPSSRIKYLARLPVTQQLVVEGKSFFLVHGTPRDPLDEYLNDDSDVWRSRLQSVEADYVCVAYHLDLGNVQVVNPGSVGQPRDGDPRCAYAVIENGRVELRRVSYDINATLRQMKEAGVDPMSLELAEFALRSGGKLNIDEGAPQGT